MKQRPAGGCHHFTDTGKTFGITSKKDFAILFVLIFCWKTLAQQSQ
jgi:hypothetical protein